ncbi:hypothetical protein CAPTEDRAFT_190139 [Capitella teleta]|uniref:Transmembrane protein 163 n=1 Tax=Capitella teleta TaxID=283909 RepID=R7UTH1_CAPTE|nr:hypothetical protein CAPTEDRAFT_190139 [Capitella teleta]|eukprot:ELU07217.1 hypothetical protein CAPTEDRAFT_190139 [Capitella teleta]
MCLGFVIVKSYLAFNLESISIATDAVNSGIGAVLAISTIIGDVVYERHPDIWYIDSVLGCICAVVLLAYGVWWVSISGHLFRQCHKCLGQSPRIRDTMQSNINHPPIPV